MGRKKLTDEAREAFRTRLLDAAATLFSEQGYEGFSIRALARALGCSAMTPYHYFEDKSAILEACRYRAFEAFAEAQESVAARHSDPMARIEALGRAYAALATRTPDQFRLLFEFTPPEQLSRRLSNPQRRAFAPLREAVAEAVQQGRLQGDVNTLANLYWAALHGVVTLDFAGKLVQGRSKRTLLKALFDGSFLSAYVHDERG